MTLVALMAPAAELPKEMPGKRTAVSTRQAPFPPSGKHGSASSKGEGGASGDLILRFGGSSQVPKTQRHKKASKAQVALEHY